MTYDAGLAHRAEGFKDELDAIAKRHGSDRAGVLKALEMFYDLKDLFEYREMRELLNVIRPGLATDLDRAWLRKRDEELARERGRARPPAA